MNLKNLLNFWKQDKNELTEKWIQVGHFLTEEKIDARKRVLGILDFQEK